MRFPLNLLLMTTTKGHFDRQDIYQTTVKDLADNFDMALFADRYASVKVSPDSEDQADPMRDFLLGYNFLVTRQEGSWKHGEQSHQTGYISDIASMVQKAEFQLAKYTLFLEDDWLLRGKNGTYDTILSGMEILDQNPNIVQVRFPRFSNEFERINRLKAKHGIDAIATKDDGRRFFYCNDWSNNPFIARSRDLFLAIMLMMKNPGAFPLHAEHGLGRAMRYLSHAITPLAVAEPSSDRVYHIGTKKGEEDKIGVELNSD